MNSLVKYQYGLPNIKIDFPEFALYLTEHNLDAYRLSYLYDCIDDRLRVIAGNILPIDVISRVPILGEEANIPYVYVPSKEVSVSFSLRLTTYYNVRIILIKIVYIVDV